MWPACRRAGTSEHINMLGRYAFSLKAATPTQQNQQKSFRTKSLKLNCTPSLKLL